MAETCNDKIFPPGWLKRDVQDAAREIAAWPDGMARRGEHQPKEREDGR